MDWGGALFVVGALKSHRVGHRADRCDDARGDLFTPTAKMGVVR
jgi:hypothetical protein